MLINSFISIYGKPQFSHLTLQMYYDEKRRKNNFIKSMYCMFNSAELELLVSCSAVAPCIRICPDQAELLSTRHQAVLPPPPVIISLAVHNCISKGFSHNFHQNRSPNSSFWISANIWLSHFFEFVQCFVLKWKRRASLEPWYWHWLQGNFKFSCLDWIWFFRLTWYDAW